jgi:glucans biosynthesis protein
MRPRIPCFLPVATIVLAVAIAANSGASGAFDLGDVAEKAEALAREPFREPKEQVPDWLLDINYDEWRQIRFRPEQALWRDSASPFQAQFFHPGLFYNRVVAINVVDAEGVHPVEFSPSQFDYGETNLASRVPQDLGYAGFRLHHPIKRRDYFDEVLVFLGASYFRAVGKHEVFGISARGLAIDTALRSGEEFPFFREFWLVRPAPSAKDIAVYALLDSPSATGAYRFAVRPGEQTVIDVEARLFPRKKIQKLGIAPLTSMFLHGENTARCREDFRPEVHDSDGLLLAFQNGEWLWRPLDNPETLQVSGFQMTSPRGFGLLQRDRNFAHYQDLETRQEQRPSVWITPKGNWGAGRVELVEIPTRNDTNDNIVAFWIPDTPPEPGKSAAFSYSMAWYGDDAARPPGGRVIATRRDRGTVEDAYRFVVDFAGRKLQSIPPERVVRGVVSVATAVDGAATLLDQHVVKNPVDGSWRLVFQVRPEGDGPVELRAFLDQGGDTLTETWSYSLLP